MTDSTTDKSNRDDGSALDKSVVKGSALASIDSSLPQTTLPRADSSGISAQIEVSKPSAGRDEFLAGLQHELETGEDRVVTARGTEDGLVLRIDGKAEWREIIAEIEAFLGGRRKFFEGSEIGIEWLERLPTVEQGKELETHLRESYGLEIRVRRRRAAQLSLAKGDSMKVEPSRDTPDQSTNRESFLQDPSRASAEYTAMGIESEGVQLTYSPDSDSAFSKRDKQSANAPIRSSDRVKTEDAFNDRPPATTKRMASTLAGVQRALFGATSKAGRTEAADLIKSNRHSGNSSHSSIDATKDVDLDSDLHGSSDISTKKLSSRMAKMLGDDLFFEDDANARVYFGTLRSGQRIETPFSLVVIGDVNPGADLVAGGDIIVFGMLRGTAHASAYDDEAHDRVIIALQMQPMQLRIGSVISRGSDECVRGAEIARIDNRRIIVEAFNARMPNNRRR